MLDFGMSSIMHDIWIENVSIYLSVNKNNKNIDIKLRKEKI
jgi:hypothetical protein